MSEQGLRESRVPGTEGVGGGRRSAPPTSVHAKCRLEVRGSSESECADDEMMTAFAKVAKQLEAKFGGLGGPKPWSLFAFAEATRLIKAAESDTSVTSHFYKASKSWSMQMQKIKQAKKIAEESKRVPRDEDDVGVDKLGGMELGDPYITFDLNPNLNNVIIVDCVLEKHGKIMGIDAGPMAGLRIQG